MRAIDMRLRPPLGGFLDGILYKADGPNKMAAYRCLEPSASVQSRSMERLLEEMDAAGVAYGVVPIRKTNGGHNEELLDLLDRYPERFIGIPHIDPLEGEQALEEIRKYVLDGPCRGVIMEPAAIFNKENWYITDERAFDAYEMCQTHGIPLLFTYGGRLVKDQGYLNPLYADRLGYLFPELNMVFCHGGWPHITQMCHAAAQHPNIYISADVYMMDFTAGYEAYVTGANYQLQDQFLFGSSYPVVSLRQAVEKYTRMLRPEVLDKVLYRNAARLFGLPQEQ